MQQSVINGWYDFSLIIRDLGIMSALFFISEDLVKILSSTSKPELVSVVQRYAHEIEEAKTETTEVNLYHLIRKMALVINDVAVKKSPATKDLCK